VASKLTRQEADIAVASIYASLNEHLDHAEKVLDALRRDLGERDHNTLYFYDDIHEAIALSGLLTKTLTRLLTSAETARLPHGA
jgi:hypothetical protein